MSGRPERRSEPAGDPDAVLRVMGAVVASAVAADRDAVSLLDDPVATDRALPMAPEVSHSGPTPAALVFTVGALGAGAVLGAVEPAPGEPEAFARWRADLLAQLEQRWEGTGSGADAVRIIGSCLARDPFDRPHPKHLVEELGRLGWIEEPRTSAMERSTPTMPPPFAVPPPAVNERRLGLVVVLLLVVTAGLVTVGAVGLGALVLQEPPAPLPPVAVEPVAPPAPMAAEVVVDPAPVVEVAPAPARVRVEAEPEEPRLQSDLIDPWSTEPK